MIISFLQRLPCRLQGRHCCLLSTATASSASSSLFSVHKQNSPSAGEDENQGKTANPVPPRKAKKKQTQSQYFVDYKRIDCQGGKGGDGMIAFLRLFCNPFAGPSGGDGGNGGHIIFVADPTVRSLAHLKSEYRANSGVHGEGKTLDGANASHIYLKVPIGTVFKDASTGEVIADLRKDQQIYVAARGGAGGRGNAFYVSNECRAPTAAQLGAEGESRSYEVELKIIAHAGLVGFPNAGKSTLLRAVSRARPKVAAYPFTTLNPYVGMIDYDDYVQLAIADIPGLLPGAHKNYGLADPYEQLEELRYELEQYQPGLSKRPQAVVANKIDLNGSLAKFEQLKEKLDSHGLKTFPISAKLGQGLEPLLLHFRQIYDRHRIEWESNK